MVHARDHIPKIRLALARRIHYLAKACFLEPRILRIGLNSSHSRTALRTPYLPTYPNPRLTRPLLCNILSLFKPRPLNWFRPGFRDTGCTALRVIVRARREYGEYGGILYSKRTTICNWSLRNSLENEDGRLLGFKDNEARFQKTSSQNKDGVYYVQKEEN